MKNHFKSSFRVTVEGSMAPDRAQEAASLVNVTSFYVSLAKKLRLRLTHGPELFTGTSDPSDFLRVGDVSGCAVMGSAFVILHVRRREKTFLLEVVSRQPFDRSALEACVAVFLGPKEVSWVVHPRKSSVLGGMAKHE